MIRRQLGRVQRLDLIGQLLKYVLLEPPQDERPHPPCDVLRLHLAERLVVREHRREREVEDGPQFVERVLDGRSGQRKPVVCLEGTDGLRDLRQMVLNRLRLVEDHGVKHPPHILLRVDAQQRVRGDVHVGERGASIRTVGRRADICSGRIDSSRAGGRPDVCKGGAEAREGRVGPGSTGHIIVGLQRPEGRIAIGCVPRDHDRVHVRPNFSISFRQL